MKSYFQFFLNLNKLKVTSGQGYKVRGLRFLEMPTAQMMFVSIKETTYILWELGVLEKMLCYTYCS